MARGTRRSEGGEPDLDYEEALEMDRRGGDHGEFEFREDRSC